MRRATRRSIMAERALGSARRGSVASATIDEARARANIEASYATITELADTIVRGGTPAVFCGSPHCRRISPGTCRRAATLATVPYEAFARIFCRSGRPPRPRMTEAAFRHVVTPEHFIAVRKLPGGPAPEAMADSLARLRRRKRTPAGRRERSRARRAARTPAARPRSHA